MKAKNVIILDEKYCWQGDLDWFEDNDIDIYYASKFHWNHRPLKNQYGRIIESHQNKQGEMIYLIDCGRHCYLMKRKGFKKV